jgi:hypothetical protein
LRKENRDLRKKAAEDREKTPNFRRNSKKSSRTATRKLRILNTNWQGERKTRPILRNHHPRTCPLPVNEFILSAKIPGGSREDKMGTLGRIAPWFPKRQTK